MRRFRYVIGALGAALLVAPLGAQEPGGTIRGRVVDEAAQQPLSGVLVTFRGRSAQTQANGQFTITGAAPGTDTLRARFLGYGPANRAVTVVAGDTVVVDLALTPQAVTLSEIVVVGYG